jgi:hypothetical protein
VHVEVPLGVAKQIAKSDLTGLVHGGLTGMTYGALGGTLTFPGVGTIVGGTGCGVAGALLGGVGKSLEKSIELFWDWAMGN